ncbi:MAG: carboxypeptidase-like regulatory domain-containing protein [Terriglobales bacterium]
MLLFAVAKSATAQSDYQVVSLGSVGTIAGTVKWSGPLPRIPTFTINKDPEICDPESHKIRDLERLIVGPQGGVANTVVFLKNISRGKALDIPEPRRFLDQKHCRYEPHILLVPEKGPLQMKSSDATLHTVHMDGAATYNLPFPFTDKVITRTMPSAGLVNLRCNGGHAWMNAEMLVVPHPYYTVTDESGRFELTDVPPGEYEIVAWHEGWKVVRQEAAFDVLTERRIQRPVFSEPKTWEKKVAVDENQTAVVTFVLADK